MFRFLNDPTAPLDNDLIGVLTSDDETVVEAIAVANPRTCKTLGEAMVSCHGWRVEYHEVAFEVAFEVAGVSLPMHVVIARKGTP